MRRAYVAGLISGFAGGLAGAWILLHFDRAALAVPAARAAPAQGEVLTASRIRMVDPSGRTRAELALSPDGGPGLFFYDTSGRNRLVLGLYSPAESELPFVVLNDTRGQAAGILRLFSAAEAPVVVLKNRGRDRSVFGLNPGTLEPFLVNYAADGRKTALFGNF